MKITDFALIFVAIMLPIILIVYVNVGFVVKAEKEEMYYKNLMNVAISDGVAAMKETENEDTDIDYGYSGIVDNKVSVNANAAIEAFYKSLFNNFNISGNKASQEIFKKYIPVVAVIDYNGVYIYSAEKGVTVNSLLTNPHIQTNQTVWSLKPKKYFTMRYCIIDNGEFAPKRYTVKNLNNVSDTEVKADKRIYDVTLSMDDYIVLNTFTIDDSKQITGNADRNSFYLNDVNNNSALVQGVLSTEELTVKAEVVALINKSKTGIISTIVSNEITYAINAHNTIAKEAGIMYNFYSPYTLEGNVNDISDNVNGIGMMAFIQGISLGNRKLNYKAYSISDLSLTKKYYLSVPDNDDISERAKPIPYDKKRLYHGSKDCPVYNSYINSNPVQSKRYLPEFMLNREEAATLGFYACPVCKP